MAPVSEVQALGQGQYGHISLVKMYFILENILLKANKSCRKTKFKSQSLSHGLCPRAGLIWPYCGNVFIQKKIFSTAIYRENMKTPMYQRKTECIVILPVKHYYIFMTTGSVIRSFGLGQYGIFNIFLCNFSLFK